MLVVQPIALAVLLIYLYGLFCRSIENRHVLNAVMGGMFGFAAVAAMSAPIPIADGVIVDIRNLFVGIAAAFFGILGGAIALLMGAAMRVSLGGDGVVLGIFGMMVAGTMACIWGYFLRERIKNETAGLLLLAFMISQHMVVALFLPPALRDSFFIGLGPTLLMANLIGALLLGKLIARERALIAETSRLENEATTDPLTKLINRKTATAAFRDLPELGDPSHGRTMLCIDVDSFKHINDTHGHIQGDKVLVEIADRLSSCLRPEDIISRISGDEFVIVLSNVTPAEAQAIAERCRNAISRKPIQFDEGSLTSSISIGAFWTQLAMSFDNLRERADQALYRAKSNGRDRVAFDIHDMSDEFAKVAVA
ncbi:MAG: diguanylate cyclase [Pseudomonadota bacterium]